MIIMRVLSFLLVLAVLSLGFSNQSYARASFWGLWSSDWQNLDFQPYIGNQENSQRSLWDDDMWTPEAWVENAGDEKNIMRNLYESNIIISQYTDRDNIPILEVGDNFISLSGVDRRRILQFVDYVFEITSSEENGMFYVFYSRNDDEPLGVYNKYGFQTY